MIVVLLMSMALAAPGRAEEPIKVTPEIEARLSGLIENFPIEQPTLMPAALDGLVIAHPFMDEPSRRAASELMLQGLAGRLPEPVLKRLPPELGRLKRDVDRTARKSPEVARALKSLRAEAAEGGLAAAVAFDQAAEPASKFLLWEALDDLKSRHPTVEAFPALTETGVLTPKAELIAGAYEPERYLGVSRLPEIVRPFEALVKRLPAPERRLWWIESKYGKAVVPTIVPSLGLLQASLNAKFGDDAVRLRPSQWATTRDEIIWQSGRGERVFGYSVPWLPPQDSADGRKAGKFEFSMHDFRHAFNASMVPSAIRKTGARIASLLQGASGGLDARKVESILNHISDGDFFEPLYSKQGLGHGLAAALLFSGRGREDVLHLIVRDWAMHPEAWPGFDLEKEVIQFGRYATNIGKESVMDVYMRSREAASSGTAPAGAPAGSQP